MTMETMNRLYGMLGLARRAGKLAAGHAACEDALRRDKARLVVLAMDASGNTKDHFVALAADYGTPVLVTGSRDRLGAALGRTTLAVLAITDGGLAQKIQELADLGESHKEIKQ